jgi:hypothetical protein
MPIRAYLPTSGAIFGPEAVANMGEAFQGAVEVLGIDPGDEPKRAAVARFIIHLAEMDWAVDAATMRDKAVLALGGPTYIASIATGRPPDPPQP